MDPDYELPYDIEVYHLDLSILAYQIHSQSLLWPMDPYYEQQGRGKTRRNDFKEIVRARHLPQGYAAPDHVDPVPFDYRQIDPSKPCFVGAEKKKWIMYDTPSKDITDRIGRTFYVQNEAADPVEIRGAGDPNGSDLLYCFEGGTGGVPGTENRPHVRSVMGFVLARYHTDGYTVHISFRGSRSGDAVRGYAEGPSGEGNADWITDMNGALVKPFKSSPDEEINPNGDCLPYFAFSIKSMLATVLKCLSVIAADNPGVAPDAIFVTGHSLGGALATHFASAVRFGTTYNHQGAGGQSRMPPRVREWRRAWPDLKVYTYGAPPVGNQKFCNAIGGIHLRRVWLEGDPIENPRFVGFATTHYPQPGTQHELKSTVSDLKGKDRVLKTIRHEPYRIRRELLNGLGHVGPRAALHLHIPGINGRKNVGEDFDDAEPWRIYRSFSDLSGDPRFADAVPATLKQGNVLTYLAAHSEYLSTAAHSAASRSSVEKLLIAISTEGQVGGEPYTWADGSGNWGDLQDHQFLGLLYLVDLARRQPDPGSWPASWKTLAKEV